MKTVSYPSGARSPSLELSSKALRDVSRAATRELGVVLTPRQIARAASELNQNGEAFGFDGRGDFDRIKLMSAARKAAQHLFSQTVAESEPSNAQKQLQALRASFWGQMAAGYEHRDALRPLIVECLREMGVASEPFEDRYVRIFPDSTGAHAFSRLADEVAHNNHDLCFSVDNCRPPLST